MSLSQTFRNLFAVMIFTSIASTSFAEDRVKIVSSFSILGDMVEQVVGEHADGQLGRRHPHTSAGLLFGGCQNC